MVKERPLLSISFESSGFLCIKVVSELIPEFPFWEEEEAARGEEKSL